ncbi:MAG TPA: flagellar filament capping protein FliD [Pusillimonas sp.]|uniref:flagellar filament capping protein FliD n=1 Tax=Pusillimonas sp. TaxID=3040095 RepID=UPI002C91212D|nr:flagellar filament capping protein FliD [Pusillimonas sp.]HUH88915.1 flagellar filament capping protein FliD [Pusillimonas sp.]
MAISSIGVGSGLPLDQLLSDLRNSENQALVLVQSKQVAAQNRLSAYGKVQSSIEALKTAAETLGKAETYGALKTTVSSEAFTASADSKAIAGQYNIKVEVLASTQTLVTDGVADRGQANGTGGVITLTLQDGTEHTLDLTGKDTSINGLIAAINQADPSLGVSATVINDGSANPHRLMLTSTTTGTEASVASITVADNADLQALLGFDSTDADSVSDMQMQAATNASLKINGITITSQTNQVEGAIEGVTLNLLKEGGDAGTLKVARDDSATTAAVKAFVTAYNNLQNTIKSLTTYDVEAQKGSALTGDSLARRAQTQARDALNGFTSEGTLRTLGQLGITTNYSTGLLETDDKKLAGGLKEHLPDVQRLLSGENGLSKRVVAMTNNFLGSKGYIQGAKDGTDQNIKDLQRQYTETSERIDAKMENYRRQFSSLDTMMAQMSSVSSYLTQQLSMLSNLNEKR